MIRKKASTTEDASTSRSGNRAPENLSDLLERVMSEARANARRKTAENSPPIQRRSFKDIRLNTIYSAD